MATDSGKKRSLLTENQPGAYKDVQAFQTSHPIVSAIADAKEVRAAALKNADEALRQAFGEKYHEMFKEKLQGSEPPKPLEGPELEKVHEDLKAAMQESFDIDELIRQLDQAPEDDDMANECRQRLDEAKELPQTDKEKMYKDIHRKFCAYVQSLPAKQIQTETPINDAGRIVKNFLSKKGGLTIKYLSYEGSLMISALTGVGSVIAMSQLLEGDRKIINDIVQDMTKKRVEIFSIWASFDEYKNFVTHIASSNPSVDEVEFTLGNRVASIPPNESSRTGGSDVKVERKGTSILIGDRIKLEKERIQNLAKSNDTTSNNVNRNPPRPQKASGRNAFEIREDILESAIDVVKISMGSDKYNVDEFSDEVLRVSEKFYEFVENKK